MSSVLAFVIVDAYEGVMNYDDLRGLGFVGPTLEKEYLSGAHGINGLINIMGNAPIKQFLIENEMKVGAVTTPWYKDGSLMTEPEIHVEIVGSDEDEFLLTFEVANNLTKLCLPDGDDDGDNHAVWAKASVMMATSTYPVLPFDLLGALDQEFVKKAKPKKKAPEFITPAPAPSMDIPMPTMPKASVPPPPQPPTAPAPASLGGDMLSGIRNMHKQFEETAQKARAKKTEVVHSDAPLHKQMFGMF
jgi:hypothetical protein